jgi:hypothetical protein
MTELIPTEAAPPEEPVAPEPVVAPVQPPKPAVVRRGGTPLLLTLVLVAALGGGLYYVWTNPQSPGANPALGDLARKVQAQGQAEAELTSQVQSAADSINQQIQALQARVDKLEKAPPPPPAPEASTAPATQSDTTDISRRLDELTAQVQTLAARPAPEPAPVAAPQDPQQVADLTAKIAQLEAAQKTALDQIASQQKQSLDAIGGRIDKLEQGAGKVETEADRAARLAMVQQASAALMAGTPLGPLPGAPESLTRFATAAPPTETGLRAAFPAVAEQARAASRPEAVKTTLWDRALARIEQSVTIRRGEHVIVGDPAAGVLAAAQDQLNNGNLAGAVHALAALQGPAAAAVAGWVAQAQALLDARVALAAMAAHP